MKLLRFLLLVTFQISQCPESFALVTIPPKLNQEFISKDTLHIILTLENSVDKVFSSIKTRRFANSIERTTAMVAELKEQTTNSQKDVLDHLSRKSSLGKVKSFWISNKISIEKASKTAIQELLDIYGSNIKDVRTAIRVYAVTNGEFENKGDYQGSSRNTLDQDSVDPSGKSGGKPGAAFNSVANAGLSPAGGLGTGEPAGFAGPGLNPVPGGGPVHGGEGVMESWGVANIGADIAHQAGYDGKGMVIGIMDSGTRWTHEALRNNMRPTYNWFDVVNGTYYSKPVDESGHGTHCTGIAAGKRIGVAPGSEWISCRVLYTDSADDDAFLECDQWFLCPTLVDGSEPDCSMKPDVVSNSWASGQMSPFFNDVIAAWQVADITPVFAAGNYGPACSSVMSPGDARDVISVGCSNINNMLTAFSSLGPTHEVHARIKPELCAPGRKIISASYLADNQYLDSSGTSMACPHMAGAVAIYKQKYPDATFTQILEAFQRTAYQWRMSDNACNYKSTNITEKWPNNYCGHGIIRLNTALGLTGKPNVG